MMFDLSIVGGGLVGASLALILSREKRYNMALIEAKPPQFKDERLFALHVQSEALLKKIGLWPSIQEYASIIQEVHVSHEGHFGIARFRPEEIGLTHLGHVIPAMHIEKALHQALSEESSVQLIQPAQLESLEDTRDAVHVRVTRDQRTEEFQSRLVVGADGAFSKVRDQLQLHCKHVDYDEIAIVSTVLFDRESCIAEQRVLKQGGTLAVLPLQNQKRAVIVSVSRQQGEALLSFSDQEYLDFLNQHGSGRQGIALECMHRQHYPLRWVQAEKNGMGRVVLLGNAMHSVHPVAAQGFNLALREVDELCSALNEYGCTPEALDAYHHRTLGFQSKTVNLSHGLSRWVHASPVFLDCVFQPIFLMLANSRMMRRFGLKSLLGMEH